MGSESSRAYLTIPEIPFPRNRFHFIRHHIYEFPFTNFSDPKFWSEFYLSILHLFDENQKSSEKFVTSHTPKQLFELFYGCLDILPNPMDILEAIIKKSIVKNRTSFTLSLLFDFHQRYSLVRFHSFITSKNYFYQVDLMNALRDQKGNTFPFDFQTIANVISKLHSLLASKKASLSSEEIDEIQKVSQAMNHALPPNEITAPLYQYFTNRPGQRMSFIAHNVYPHCITSNGNFIFILTDSSVLYIFPLICNGSILQPITRKMNFKTPVNQLFSIAASNLYLFIFSSKFKRIYRISDLLSSLEEDINDYNTLYGIFNSRHTSTVNQNDPEGNSNENISDSNTNNNSVENVNVPKIENGEVDIDDDEHSYIISDGMIMAQLSGVRSCQIILFDSQTRRILNYKSSLKTLNYSKPIALTPIAISGAYIAFVSHVDQQTFIMKVFSLLTGQTIIEEQFTTIDQIIAVTIDSINHCSYAIISGINGNMEVRRYSFLGSYTPFLFNFAFKIYNTEKKIKKKNAFKAISCSLNIIMIQLLGTHIIPPSLLATSKDQMQTIVNSLKKISADVPTDSKVKLYYIQSLQFLSSLIDINLRNYEIKKGKNTKEYKESSEKKSNPIPENNDKNNNNNESDKQIIESDLIKQILGIIPSLPPNIGSFLFFMHISLFFELSMDQSINILYNFFNTNNNPSLANFCLNQLERCEIISKIPFDSDNSLSLLIPQKLDPVSSISKLFLSFLYVHQHVLISSTFQYLETSSPIIIVNKDKNGNDDELNQFDQFRKPNANGEKTPVDYFLDYALVVINRFITAISDNSSITKIDVYNSLIFKIFDNFLRIITIMSNASQIAHPITILLAKAILKLAVIPNGVHKDQRLINNSINFVYYVFAQYVASLFQGGGQCGMEKSFYWLIKSNLDLSEKHDSEWISHLDSPELNYFDDEKIFHFINNSFPVSKSEKKKKTKKRTEKKTDKVKLKNIDVDKLMDLLYNKYKKQFNRRLSKEIQQFDRIVLIGTAKHLKIIHEILKFNEKSTLTPQLKSALDQMIRIRSAYRQIIQRKGDTTGIMKRALFLCRINSCSTDVKSLGEFITSHINVSALVKIILLQPSRIQITIAGFSIMSKMVELKTENNIFLNCIADCLSTIEDFSGFSSIVMSTDLSEKQKSKVYQFFSNIFKIYNDIRNPQLLLIPFRFFRHLNKLHSLQGKLFLKVNDILREDVNDLPLFSLVYSLVKKFGKVSRHKLKYDKDDNNDPFLSKNFTLSFDMNAPVNWLLLSAYLTVNFCSEDLFHIITKYFWKMTRSDKEPKIAPRVICRVIYNALMNQGNSNQNEDISSAQMTSDTSTSNQSSGATPILNKIQEMTVAKFIKKALVFISRSLLGCDLKLNKFSIELVYLFRKIINAAPVSDLDTKPTTIATTILNDMMNVPKNFKATLAIIGLQVDIVRPYALIRQNFKQKEYSPNASLIRKSSAESPLSLQTSNNSSARINLDHNNLSSSRLLFERSTFSPSSSTIIDYVAIPNGKDLKFIPLPFDIKAPSLSLKNTDVHAFPILEVNDNVLSSFGNYVLSFMEMFSGTNNNSKPKSKLQKMFNDLVVQNLYMQTLSFLAMRPEFVNGITKEFIGILSSKMELFSSINDLFDDAISIVSQIEEVDDEIDGLYKIQGEKYNSYLTKPLIDYVPDKRQKLSFTIDAKGDPNNIDLYFGIVSDSFYQHNIRYELINYPSGWHYPIGKQHKKIKFPLNIEINIDERTFSANTTKFNFPQGTRFRFVISSKVDPSNPDPKFTITSNDNYISFFKENSSDIEDDGYDQKDYDDNDIDAYEYFEDEEDENENEKQDNYKTKDNHTQANKLKTNYFLKDTPEDNEALTKLPSEIFLKVRDYHNEYLNDPSSFIKKSPIPKELISRSYNDVTPVEYDIPSFSNPEIMRSYYISPLDEIPLHIFDSKKASKHLIRVIWNSYIYKLSGQFATICLMRIALIDPFQLMLQEPDSNPNANIDISNISELFINLILSTETFRPELFANRKFFFGLECPPWLSQSLTANSSQNVVSGYESEALEALNILINLDEEHGIHNDDDDDEDSFQSDSSSYRSADKMRDTSDILLMKKMISKEIIRGMAKRIYHLAAKPRSHLCAVQNPYVHLYLKSYFTDNVHALDSNEIPEFNQNSLLAVPDFQNKLADYPIFLGPLVQASESYNYMSNFSTVSYLVKNSDTIFINVKRYDNSWVKDTIYEMLLLLKNFMFIIQDADLEIFIRSILIELYVSESPFSRPFNIDFMTKIFLQHPVSPIYTTPSYIKKLSLLGTYLQTLPPSQKEYVTRNDTSGSVKSTVLNTLSNAAQASTEPPVNLYSLDLSTDDFFRLYYKIDSKMVNDPINKRVIQYFPEFFTAEDQQRINDLNNIFNLDENDEKSPRKCKIRRVCIDPGAIKSTDMVVEELLIMVKVQHRYKSIVGFPFWEILPYYYRLLKEEEQSDDNDSSSVSGSSAELIEKDFIPPTVYKDKNGIVIVDNSTGVPLHLSLIIVHGNFYSSSVLMYSVSPLFEVAEYVTSDKVSDVITIKEGKTYFSMTGFRGIWKIKFIDEFLHKHKKESYEFNSTDNNNNNNNSSMFRKESDKKAAEDDDDFFEIDVDEIKKTFIKDMKMFAVEWRNVDSEVLANQIPPAGTKNRRFQAVSSIAESCQQLTSKFSPIVVKLRALFIHHFNYFLYVSSQATDRYSPYYHSKIAMDIPDQIKMMLKEWVSDEEASKSLFDAIKCNESYREITINRFLSKRLVEEGEGTFNDSIIAQLSRQFSRFDPSLFRNKTRPWSVTFEDEKAVDAGGPMRELMTEVARSIFLPSSEIFIPVREFFVPFSAAQPKNPTEAENDAMNTTTTSTSNGNGISSSPSTANDNDDDKSTNVITPTLNHRLSVRRRSSNHNLNFGSVPVDADFNRRQLGGRSRRRNSNDDIRASQINLAVEQSFMESCKEMKLKMYWAVGQFIAIIVRTGFPQSLPFAPLVWKFIAEAKITREDVFASDPEFASTMKKILSKPDLYMNSPEVMNWQTTQWDGTVVTLPQHQGKSQSSLNPLKTMANNNNNGNMMMTTQNNYTTKYRNQKRNPQVNIYVNECIRFRIDSILPMLKEIRNGFTANVGFEFNPILSGPLLSHLAQGSDIITVEQLKYLTVPLDFDADGDMQYIDRFWRVVERFTSLQRHHMLRFITTLTRIPITTKSQFGIKIDKYSTQNPDNVMPTASTCFNKLHWPCYTNDDIAYEKFSFAIENCQSLDLT